MNAQPKPPQSTWWAIWFALISGVFVIYFVIGNQTTHQGITGSPLWIAGATPVAVSTIIRVFLLPRMDTAARALPMFVAGMAMAESAAFLGMFLFPDHKAELLILSVLGMAIYVPFFAPRFYR